MSRLPEYQQRVRPEWIDYNGHLSEGYYVLVFGFATDAVLDQLGMDAEYRQRTECSLYTVEAHVRYLREVNADADMSITTRIIDAGTKKLRMCHEMRVDDVLVSTEEIMALHVDSTQGGTTPFPADIAERAAELVEAAPDYAGRAIG